MNHIGNILTDLHSFVVFLQNNGIIKIEEKLICFLSLRILHNRNGTWALVEEHQTIMNHGKGKFTLQTGYLR